MMNSIPKRLGHIWIGPKPMPRHWMQTWPEKHPDWEYRIYDNDFLMEFPFRNRRLINEYFWRGEYAGVQDLMRYEILYKFGGFMADADSICLHPVDELLKGKRACTVYDQQDTEKAGVSPFLAAEPRNPVLGEVIDRLGQLQPWDLLKPWRSTGNRFLIRAIREIGEEKVTIWPSHYFIPWHHSDPEDVYSGPDKVYAEQQWGTTRRAYNAKDVAAGVVKNRAEINAEAEELRSALVTRAMSEMAPELPQAQVQEPDVQRADLHIDAWEGASQSAAWAEGLQDLNTTLSTALIQAGLPPRIEAEPFYCLRQKKDLPSASLIVKTDPLRIRLAAWMSQAETVVQVGLDGGHLALLQKILQPHARLVIVDPGGRIEGDHAAAAKVYVSAAVNWLRQHFGDSIQGMIGWPGATLTRYFLNHPEFRADLVHINGISSTFLSSYGAAVEALKPGGHVIISHTNAEQLRRRVQQLQIIGEAGTPLDYAEFGRLRGAFAVLRPGSGHR
ncbi:MAG: glycosyltransferase family 32 protein [Halocynthiibacter sp.]